MLGHRRGWDMGGKEKGEMGEGEEDKKRRNGDGIFLH